MMAVNNSTSVQTEFEDRPGCIQAALNILGDKWSPLLLGILFDGGKTFGELEETLDGISPRTLSARLERLIYEGIITKVPYCEHPPRYRYCLTEKGSDLRSILIRMAEWGEKHQPIVTAPCDPTESLQSVQE